MKKRPLQFNPDDIITAFWDSLNRQVENLVLWMPVAMGVGIGAYFSLPYEPQDYSLAILFPICLAFFFFLRKRATRLSASAYAFVFFMTAFMALGFSAAQYNTEKQKAPVLKEEIGPLSVQGQIVDVDRKEKGMRYVLNDLQLEGYKGALPEKVRVMVRNMTVKPNVGDRIEVLAILSPPSAPVVPDGFDFQRFNYFHQIGGMGFALSPVKIIQERQTKPFFEDLRQRMIDEIYASIDDKGVASITATFMTGEKSGIPEEVLDKVRAAGLAHLLAISGQHVAFIVALIFFMVRAFLALIPSFALKYPIKQISAFITLIASIFVMMIIEFSVPVQRAVIMSAIVLLAVMLGRVAISLRLVAITAAAILIYEPYHLISASFQLSFAAVIALVYFYEVMKPHYHRLTGETWFGKAVFYVGGLGLSSLIAGLATAPFTLYHFSQYAVYGLLGNILVLPVVGLVIMPLVVIGYIAFFIGLGKFVFPLAGYFINWIVEISDFVSSLDGSVFMMPMWPVASIILFSLGSLIFILWKGHFVKAFAVGIILASFLLSGTTRQPDILMTDDLKLIAVKNKQGDYLFSQARGDKFIRENWMQSIAQSEALYWPKKRGHVDDVLSCDEEACLYKIKNKTISFIKEKSAIRKDCAIADLVVFKGYPAFNMGCAYEKMLHSKQLKGAGVSYLYVEEGKPLSVKNTKADRGDRPWVN